MTQNPMTGTNDENQIIPDRRAKLAKLRAAGPALYVGGRGVPVARGGGADNGRSVNEAWRLRTGQPDFGVQSFRGATMG